MTIQNYYSILSNVFLMCFLCSLIFRILLKLVRASILNVLVCLQVLPESVYTEIHWLVSLVSVIPYNFALSCYFCFIKKPNHCYFNSFQCEFGIDRRTGGNDQLNISIFLDWAGRLLGNVIRHWPCWPLSSRVACLRYVTNANEDGNKIKAFNILSLHRTRTHFLRFIHHNARNTIS